MFPPPTAGPFPLDEGFYLSPTLFSGLFMLGEETGFGCGEGKKSDFKHFVYQLRPLLMVLTPL